MANVVVWDYITVVCLGFLCLYGKEDDTRGIVRYILRGKLDMVHEAIFFPDEMIRWEHGDDGLRRALVDMRQRKENSRSSFFVRGLHDDVLLGSRK
jgi:hypothetical protein